MEEGNLIFDFPENWIICKFDEQSFFRNNFSKVKQGLKAVDFCAIDKDSETLWLIEVKDYREHKRTKEITPEDEMIQKVLDTQSCLFSVEHVAKNIFFDEDFLNKIRDIKNLKYVLHYETQNKKYILDLQTKLCSKFHHILNSKRDIQVVSSECGKYPWKVIQKTEMID